MSESRRNSHAHHHARWSRLVWMYHSVPSRSNPNDWVLYGILVVGAIVLILGGGWALRTYLDPEQVYVAGAGGMAVRFVEATPRDGSVYITVESAGGRREIAVREDSPLAQQAMNLRPGMRFSVPLSALR